MVSEGSRNTEGWSNDAEDSALHHRNKWHIQMNVNALDTFQYFPKPF